MLANWFHIVIVHLVVIGTPILMYRVWSHRNEKMDQSAWKTTYTWLIIMAGCAAISYFTGPEAAEWTKQVVESYSQDQVEDHALWGRITFVIHGITGLLGVMGWASLLQEEIPDRRIGSVVLFLLAVNTGIVIYTAHLGGLIRRMDLLF